MCPFINHLKLADICNRNPTLLLLSVQMSFTNSHVYVIGTSHTVVWPLDI